MKMLALISLVIITNSCFAQLPDLIGEKASIEQIKRTYTSYNVEEGRLLDVGSYNKEDNIYVDAKITGEFLDSQFNLTSDRNGKVNFIYYAYNAIKESDFNFLKSTIIKLHSAKYSGTKNNVTIYTSTLFGISRYISFEWNSRGSSYVAFMIQ